jgi:hypothetical protein
LSRYQPGQTVTVTFSGGYRRGWVRAILRNQNGAEIDRVTGPTGAGDDGSGSPNLQFPVMLAAPSPSTPGFYRWTVSWFGSPYDAGNSTVFPHVQETVSTNQFEVYVVPTCQDADSDGYEDSACNADPMNGGGDCDDTDASVNPGMTEIPYNGVDDDCEPSTPDDDIDNDGYAAALDCDDNDPDVNPGAAEACDDGIDNDCDGAVDAADTDCEPPPPVDVDGDGYAVDTDCDDTDPTVNPGAAEVCDDGIDNDCDGLVDAADPDCEGPPPVDADGDGYTADADCDDANPAINPGAAEVCDDGIDNDCDGLVDDADPDCEGPPPSAIHLLGPANGAHLLNRPTFTWSSDSANYFRVEFSLDPAFGTVLSHSPVLRVTTFTPLSSPWSKAPQSAPIYWRVRGADGSVRPIVIQTSESWSFIKDEASQPSDDDDKPDSDDDGEEDDDHKGAKHHAKKKKDKKER